MSSQAARVRFFASNILGSWLGVSSSGTKFPPSGPTGYTVDFDAQQNTLHEIGIKSLQLIENLLLLSQPAVLEDGLDRSGIKGLQL